MKARLFLRENVTKLGIAPLTSMYFFGENQPARPHATTGPRCTTPTACSIQSGTGEWIWRPLVNPQAAARHVVRAHQSGGLRPACSATAPSTTTRTSRRATTCGPSAWVEPRGSWGAGRIELVQIPDARRDQRQHRRVLGARRRCRRRASRSTSSTGCCGRRRTRRGRRSPWVTQTRRGHGYSQGAGSTRRLRRRLRGPGAEEARARRQGRERSSPPTPTARSSRADAYRNEVTGGWRLRAAREAPSTTRSRSSCAPSCAVRTSDAVADVELHRCRRSEALDGAARYVDVVERTRRARRRRRRATRCALGHARRARRAAFAALHVALADEDATPTTRRASLRAWRSRARRAPTPALERSGRLPTRRRSRARRWRRCTG